MTMTSSKPYLIRALYDWIVDNKQTPYLLVDAFSSDVMVPQQHVKDGQIILNVSPSAIVDLNVDGKGISFNARFGGIPTDVYAPMHAVLGIYARENGRGMMFDPEEPPPGPRGPAPVDGPAKPKKKSTSVKDSDKERPSLRVVK